MWIIRTYIGTFRKFDDFGGRANRAEFRNFGIVPFVIQLCFPVIGALSPVGYLFENVFSLVPLVPAVSLVVRRLHDTGTNGWLVLPGLVPFLNFLVLYLLFFLLQRSVRQRLWTSAGPTGQGIRFCPETGITDARSADTGKIPA